MKLFEKQEAENYFSSILNKLKNEVDCMSDETIATCEFSKWSSYLYSKYEIAPIIIFEDNIEQSISESIIRKYNTRYCKSSFEEDYFTVDGYRIVYKIPFDGDSELLYVRPNPRLMTRFDVSKYTIPSKDTLGSFELEFEYTNQELIGKGENMQSFVRNRFETEFSDYRKMIGYVNQEVHVYNEHLSDYVKECLEERREKASSFAMISQILEIPLKRNKNAPEVVPVSLKRIERSPVTTPSKEPNSNKYAISDADYDNINRIIYSCGTIIEKTARTYFKHSEEQLRDHLLATLGTHYDNATGETFRKIGKTDISIEFDNSSAYIGECKIWQGKKIFTEAVQQVLNYSTWRDVKVSVIIFNKKNQSFSSIVSQLDAWVQSNTQSHMKPNQNMWDCKYYREDMKITIRLTILAFDLYVDQTQFKDNRN